MVVASLAHHVAECKRQRQLSDNRSFWVTLWVLQMVGSRGSEIYSKKLLRECNSL